MNGRSSRLLHLWVNSTNGRGGATATRYAENSVQLLIVATVHRPMPNPGLLANKSRPTPPFNSIDIRRKSGTASSSKLSMVPKRRCGTAISKPLAQKNHAK